MRVTRKRTEAKAEHFASDFCAYRTIFYKMKLHFDTIKGRLTMALWQPG